VEELQRRTQLPRGELRQSLGRLRAAGLVRVVPARLRPGNGAHGTAYLPGPQFHRLTEAARRRLQEELILAAGPDTPLAAAIRRRRSHENSTHEKEHS
jgi:DNA-binding IclR family transcriptional regulator